MPFLESIPDGLPAITRTNEKVRQWAEAEGSFLLGPRGARRKRCRRCSQDQKGHECEPARRSGDAQSSDSFDDDGRPSPAKGTYDLCHSCRRVFRRHYTSRATSCSCVKWFECRRREPVDGTDGRASPYQDLAIESYCQEGLCVSPTTKKTSLSRPNPRTSLQPWPSRALL